MEGLVEFARLGGFVLAIVVFFHGVYLHRSGVRRAELDKRDAEIADIKKELQMHVDTGKESRGGLRDRIAHLESNMRHVPDKDAVHNLAVGQEEMRGDIKEQGANLKSATASIKRIEDFLMKTGSK